MFWNILPHWFTYTAIIINLMVLAWILKPLLTQYKEKQRLKKALNKFNPNR